MIKQDLENLYEDIRCRIRYCINKRQTEKHGIEIERLDTEVEVLRWVEECIEKILR